MLSLLAARSLSPSGTVLSTSCAGISGRPHEFPQTRFAAFQIFLRAGTLCVLELYRRSMPRWLEGFFIDDANLLSATVALAAASTAIPTNEHGLELPPQSCRPWRVRSSYHSVRVGNCASLTRLDGSIIGAVAAEQHLVCIWGRADTRADGGGIWQRMCREPRSPRAEYRGNPR